MGQHTLLRILTQKSTMKFGTYADYTVFQILSFHKHGYLRWVYYNCANISFSYDILELLYISEMQIDKPGKDERTGEYVAQFFSHFQSFKLKKHTDRVRKCKAKAKLANLYNNINTTKTYLQGKNHGR